MAELWWRVRRNRWSRKPEAVLIEHETARYVRPLGGRHLEAKRGVHHAYFRTWDEARDAVLHDAQRRHDAAVRAAERLEDHLREIEGWTEPPVMRWD